MDFETIRYEVDGPVATITLDRPDAANAQNTQLIDELDAAFDSRRGRRRRPRRRARRRGQALLGRPRPQGDPRGRGALGRDAGDARGQARATSRSCTATSSCGSATSARSRSPRCRARARPPGLMLACMCDLIVAADDARFSNPVLRMSGVGVELLVEPWELGPRKAKEFLLCAETLDAERGRALRARQPGRAARRARRPRRARWPSQVALVPPLTARGGQGLDQPHGRRAWASASRWRYHFMVHQFVCNTPTALGRTEARKAGGMDAVQARAGRRADEPDDRTARGPPGPRPRHADRRAVLRRAARRAGRRGHQDRAARRRRLHARDRPVRPGRRRRRAGYSLFWAVEGRGRKSVTLDLRTPRGPGPVPPPRRDRRRRRRELPARHARAVAHRARPTSTRGSSPCASRMFGQDGPYSQRPGPRPRRHRLRRPAAPHRLPRPAAGARRRHDLRLPHRRVRGAGRGRARCTRATCAAAARARSIDAALYGAVLRILEWTLAAYDRLGIVRSREGNRLANSAPLDNYPTADGKYVCIVAGSDANFARLCKAMDRPDLLDDPRFAQLADRAARGDEINGIVAEWTAARTRGRGRGARASRATCPSRPRTPRPTSSPTRTSPPAATSSTVDDPVIGPVRQQAPFPRFVGEPVAGADRRAAARRAHRRRCSASSLGVDAAELDALRDRGDRVMPTRRRRPVHRRAVRADDPPRAARRLLPTMRRATTSRASTTCPYCGADEVDGRRAVRPRARCGAGPTVTARAARATAATVPFGFGVVELPEGAARHHPARRARPTRSTFGQPMQLRIVAAARPTTTAPRSTTWEFAP